MLSYNICRSEPVLCLNGVDINSKKCTNTFIRQIFYKNRFLKPRGNFLECLLHRYYVKKSLVAPLSIFYSNKLRELHLKILHNIYVLITLCQNVWILMKTAHFVQITIQKVLGRLIPVCPRRKLVIVVIWPSKRFFILF